MLVTPRVERVGIVKNFYYQDNVNLVLVQLQRSTIILQG